MKTLVAILKKIGDERDNTVKTLCDLMPLSYAEIYEKYHDIISDDEARILFRQAQIQKKKNKFTDAKIVSRNNPQIKNIPLLYTGQPAEFSHENEFIPDRISEYVEPGMVSSMFSPAAYLTELYREARELHKSDSDYYLDKRRPDLKDLSLSQENLTDEVSTLELSNDVLFASLKGSGDKQSVLKRLSEKYQSVKLPYHEPFQIIREVVSSKKIFSAINKYPSIINNKKTDKVALKNSHGNLSPALLAMLQKIYSYIDSDDNIERLIEEYITPSGFLYFYSLEYVMGYFELTNGEFNLLSNLLNISNVNSRAEEKEKTEYKKKILKIKGVVSLCNASQLSLNTMVHILKSFNCMLVNKEIIDVVVNIKSVKDKYNLCDEDITVLLGGNIVKDKVNKGISQFDRVFNNPPLGGKKFNDSETEIDFFTGNYADGSEEQFIINCLKRAFGVNESVLAELCHFIYGQNKKVNCNMAFLSLFYRTILMARINNISVNELIMLFYILPDIFKVKISAYKTSDEIYDVLYNINYFLTWLSENDSPVIICYSLLHNSSDVIISQDVNNVISEIASGLNKDDLYIDELTTNELIIKLSPALSSVLDVSSVSAMESVLLWVDALKPEGVDIKTLFFNIYSQAASLEQKYNKVIISIIKMSVMINMISIDDILLSSWVKKPALLDASLSQLKYDLITIKMMTDANSVVKSTSEKSDLVISKLNDGGLSSITIADLFNQNEKTVQQVLNYHGKRENIKDYRSLTDIKTALNLFSEIDVSPDDFAKLFGVNTESKNFDYYHNISKIAESTLEPEKLDEIKKAINKIRSQSLCSLYILEKMNDTELNSNNNVYKYLLIDTEISEEIKTTRIAEAIAGIQLYVNNCLNNLEKDVQDSVRTRSFFLDWEEYNRRYSTWAGLSMLVYYPENYIDPVIRAGKTAMMDNLQQRISQEGIKKEAVDDAFRTYLTEFDQVANLNVISAYHNEIDMKKGKTFFIGNSYLNSNFYYWRSLNNELIKDGENGFVIPPSSWTEWKKIDCGVSPYKNMLRLVVFNSRIYLVWLEYSESKGSKTDKAPSYIKISMNFSYLRYDNSWSEHHSVDLSEHQKALSDLGIKNNSDENVGFYCSSYIDGSEMLIIFYNKLTNVAFMVKDDFLLEIKSKSDSEVIYEQVKEYLEVDGKKPVINVISSNHILFSRDESKDFFLRNKGAYNINYSFVEGAGLLFDSERKKYKSIVKYDLCLGVDKFSDAQLQYGSWSDLCFDNGWYDHDVDYNIVYLVNKFKYQEYLIDCIVFLFDIKNDGCILFFYSTDANSIVKFSPYFFKKIILSIYNRSSEPLRLDVTDMQDNIYIRSGGRNIYSVLKNEYSDETYVYFDLQNEKDTFREQTEKRVNVFLRNAPTLDKVTLSINISGESHKVYEEQEWSEPRERFDGNQFLWKSKGDGIIFEIEQNDINNYNGKDVEFVFKGLNNDDLLFVQKIIYRIDIFDVKKNIMTLNSHSSGAQYIKFSDSKNTVVRLNTLFSKRMIATANKGIDYILTIDNQNLVEPDITSINSTDLVPMDFNGANGIYFWELFYYAPMMIADILLQHQSYNETERWLRYIFNPAGYIKNSRYTGRYWNVRPLKEDIQWDETLPDETDPDAIALADPMHYKMAVFMKTLDLIIARGDAAYRELERDTLNEAKSWYMQALSLLGKEPVVLLNKDWSSPRLADTADKTAQTAMQRLLMQMNNPEDLPDISVKSANTLTAIFKPQINDKLMSYREVINQRLFNLRNGLSISGQRLYLPIFSLAADPANMLELRVNNINSERNYDRKSKLMYRFPVVIENAKSIVSQLIEFGSQLLGYNERCDDERLAELLIYQGDDLIYQSILIQDEEIKYLLAERKSLLAQQREIANRTEHYKNLYDEFMTVGEKVALALSSGAVLLSASSRTIKGSGMLADLAPNTFGMSFGGSKWSAATESISEIMGGTADGMSSLAEIIEKSEEYRRRRDEWQLELESGKEELQQIAADLESMDIQITAANMQRQYIITEQKQNQQQLQFLQRKFTRAELYGWLRGRLMAVYSPLYDLAISRCLMAETAYRYEMNVKAEDRAFIKFSGWKSAYSGLMAGESLMLNLTQLEDAYLKKDKRVLEVTRTVSLAKEYSQLTKNPFSFSDVTNLVRAGKTGKLGQGDNYVAFTDKKELEAVIGLKELEIYNDYPADLGDYRLILQISVTLPALIEPYQNVRALLEYEGEGDSDLPEGCKSIAISHGMNDSGLFHLQFGDSKYLPFEGLSVNSNGKFKLRFFGADSGDQKRLLETLTDIVLHIRYTIYK